MSEGQNSEKAVLRVIFDKVVLPAFAFGAAWIFFYLWPPILLVYLGVFVILVVVGAVGYWKGEC